MPRLSSWFIRSSLLYLALGFTLGAVTLWQKGAASPPGAGRLLPLHVDGLLLGFMAELAVGVAYWILPRTDGKRGRAWLLWLAYGLLNAGIWLVGLTALFSLPGAVALAGRAAEAIAAPAFAGGLLMRVKPPPLV